MSAVKPDAHTTAPAAAAAIADAAHAADGVTLRCELLVIGAGPAGLAAATQAASQGIDTLLLDEQPAPGGQIYRAVTYTPLTRRDILGPDYWHGGTLVQAFEQSGARYQADALVWAVMPLPDQQGYELGATVAGQACRIITRTLILATGAQERPFPIPGWTLPGVLGAGAAQILLKQSGALPGDGVVLAGGGPLLYLLAWQYLNAGVRIDALLETVPRGQWRQALPHAWDFLRSPYLRKGLQLMLKVRKQVPIVRDVAMLEAIGQDGRLSAVRYRRADAATVSEIAASHLLLHQGVVPNTNLARALGLAHDYDDDQLCWRTRVDDWGAASLPGVYVAGDGAGIAGALAAEHRGRLAALDAARQLGRLNDAQRDQSAAAARTALQRANRGRRFLDRLYQPPGSLRRPTGDTIVCRCEEVTAQQVRETAALGVQGPNQMKAFLRCGMGPCQGRFCGLTVSELIADVRQVPVAEVGYYRVRYPTKPVTLAEMAALPQTEASRKAVVRFKK